MPRLPQRVSTSRRRPERGSGYAKTGNADTCTVGATRAETPGADVADQVVCDLSRVGDKHAHSVAIPGPNLLTHLALVTLLALAALQRTGAVNSRQVTWAQHGSVAVVTDAPVAGRHRWANTRHAEQRASVRVNPARRVWPSRLGSDHRYPARGTRRTNVGRVHLGKYRIAEAGWPTCRAHS